MDTNIPIDTAKEIYGRLLPENKKAIFGMSVEELSQLQGMGRATATRLKGILDFGKRIAQSEFPVNLKIKSSHCAYKLILPYLMGQDTEYFYAIMVARNNRAINMDIISDGGTTGTVGCYPSNGQVAGFIIHLSEPMHSIILLK